MSGKITQFIGAFNMVVLTRFLTLSAIKDALIDILGLLYATNIVKNVRKERIAIFSLLERWLSF